MIQNDGGGSYKGKPARSNGDGSGVQRMGGGDYNYIAPNPTGAAARAAASKKATATSIINSGLTGTAAAAASGPTAAQKAAAAEAARKQSIRNQYGQAQDQNSAVYDAASAQIGQQVNGIDAGYNRAIAAIARDATTRVAQDRGTNRARAQAQAKAAADMGLDFVPTTQGAAAATQGANRGALLRNEQAWRGMLTAQHQNALQRNQAQASTFTAGKVSESAVIEQLMLKALGLA